MGDNRMSKLGTLLIKGLIAEKNAREAARKRKKDGAWQNDAAEYAKRKAKADKQMSEPVVTSQFKPICPQCGNNNKGCGFYENNLQKIREKQKTI
jgi:hypothetical protein